MHTRQTSKRKYQTCLFTKTYVLLCGNTDFYQPVVNIGHLSMLNSVEFMLPCIFLFLMPEAPQARIILLPPLQTGTFGFGLYAKMAQSSARHIRFYTRLGVT